MTSLTTNPPGSVNPYYNFDFWASQVDPGGNDMVELTIFMPNGILLIIKASKCATLAELKEVN